ncbi:hypothetical protein VN97_g10120 [Penicillium thymicola]|uniref:Uncharacterized protein n=1 Tax=Penicillium thymicola TaxID=293382 RepID=A0AAI9TAQ2_PENTH|nr:hypothetical protein VN97_g10120 [Penicillium thymicola]
MQYPEKNRGSLPRRGADGGRFGPNSDWRLRECRGQEERRERVDYEGETTEGLWSTLYSVLDFKDLAGLRQRTDDVAFPHRAIPPIWG